MEKEDTQGAAKGGKPPKKRGRVSTKALSKKRVGRSPEPNETSQKRPPKRRKRGSNQVQNSRATQPLGTEKEGGRENEEGKLGVSQTRHGGRSGGDGKIASPLAKGDRKAKKTSKKINCVIIWGKKHTDPQLIESSGGRAGRSRGASVCIKNLLKKGSIGKGAIAEGSNLKKVKNTIK